MIQRRVDLGIQDAADIAALRLVIENKTKNNYY